MDICPHYRRILLSTYYDLFRIFLVSPWEASINYIFTLHPLVPWNIILFTLSPFHLYQELTNYSPHLLLNGWCAKNGFSIFKGWWTSKTTQNETVGPAQLKIFTIWPFAEKVCRPQIFILGEWLWFIPSISVSTFSRYHWCHYFSTTASSEDFNFALTSLGALQSLLWLLFNSSSCLYISTSPLFMAFVPESWNIYLMEFWNALLLSSSASFLRTCS